MSTAARLGTQTAPTSDPMMCVCRKVVPRAMSESIVGVFTVGSPIPAMASHLWSSAIIKSTFGCEDISFPC